MFWFLGPQTDMGFAFIAFCLYTFCCTFKCFLLASVGWEFGGMGLLINWNWKYLLDFPIPHHPDGTANSSAVRIFTSPWISQSLAVGTPPLLLSPPASVSHTNREETPQMCSNEICEWKYHERLDLHFPVQEPPVHCLFTLFRVGS